MERGQIIDALLCLNENNPLDCDGDIIQLLECNILNLHSKVNISLDEIKSSLTEITKFNPEDDSPVWTYLFHNFYLLNTLKTSLNSSTPEDVLSVRQTNLLKTILHQLTGIGIRCNLLNNLPQFLNHKSESFRNEDDLILKQYCRLATTTFFMIDCLKCKKLRAVIVQECFQGILNSLYQIIYCPLKKPTADNGSNSCGNSDKLDPATSFDTLEKSPEKGSKSLKLSNKLKPNTSSESLKKSPERGNKSNKSPEVLKKLNTDKLKFKMTPELYTRFMEDKLIFKTCLDYCSKSIHKTVYCRESMVMMGTKTPLWFQKAVSTNLTKILQSEKGVETITLALMDNAGDYDVKDSTKTWKIFDVLIKLIMSLYNTPDFHSNICTQIENLLLANNVIFEQLFVACVKTFYVESMDVFNRLIKNVCQPLIQLTLLNHSADITTSINQSVRLLYSIFIITSANYPEIHIKIISPYTAILFRLFSATITSNLCDLNHHISQLLIKYIAEYKHRNVEIFDALLFNRNEEGTFLIKRNLFLEVKNASIQAILREGDLRVNMNQIGDDLIKLLRNHGDLLMGFFIYLLHCLSNKENYFKVGNNKDLLQLEEEFVLDLGIERNLLVYNLLSNLSDNKTIQNQINSDPTGVIDYIHGVIKKAVDNNLHMTKEVESDEFQSVFVTIMILQALVGNCAEDNRYHYEALLEPLRCILTQCLSEELRGLVGEIVQTLEKGCASQNGGRRAREITDLDKAIGDVCDPLLPIRGHGLMVLGKLVQKKDKHAMERKLFILNIFQQNLKNEDSYIYLSSINGLAAMADVFPDTVLRVITEEYSDFSRKDAENSNELRMKIGEVLVRVTKMLGEMAPKYKSLLLNTFLNGTKDEDHLMRASNLSNLGEICRVLGYKLGSIAIEVLACVHAIITTDKAVEARRAAVTVIRQLFAGLESEMIAFLKDDILEIYRSLKNIYQNDRDDVMRLQAQLALEELNENMKQFVFPKPQLNFEKKIVVMKE